MKEKEYKKSTLLSWKKEDLVEHILCLQHNYNVVSEAKENMYNNYSKVINSIPTIRKWVDKVHDNAKAHGWYDGKKKNFGELLMLVVTEVAEAMEEYRNGKGFKETYYTPEGKMKGIPSELADIVIRVFDICGYYKIDLESAVKEKHEYNTRRPYKHGGKKC